MRKSLLAVLFAVILLLSVTTVLAADSAMLSIVPEQTKVVADGGETHITYTITVLPHPRGRRSACSVSG